MIQVLKKLLISTLAVSCLLIQGLSVAQAEEEFPPAYENMASFEPYDKEKYMVRHQGRNYYTSGKKNGFLVNENNEESTDETIGILLTPFILPTMVVMNLIGLTDD